MALPEEVEAHLRWALTPPGSHLVRPHIAHAFLKADWTRSAAWQQISGTKGQDWNPWKRAHTKNYWAWYCLLENLRVDELLAWKYGVQTDIAYREFGHEGVLAVYRAEALKEAERLTTKNGDGVEPICDAEKLALLTRAALGMADEPAHLEPA